LWVNLAKKDKMIDPAYQEMLDKDIPRSAWLNNMTENVKTTS
jgi:redox-sensitive bicupin YhaK (pirin superfamily)